MEHQPGSKHAVKEASEERAAALAEDPGDGGHEADGCASKGGRGQPGHVGDRGGLQVHLQGVDLTQRVLKAIPWMQERKMRM